MADTAVDPGAGVLTFTGYAPLVTQSYIPDQTALLLLSLPQLFPRQEVQVLNPDGTFTNEWYRYFATALESSITGVNALDPAAVAQAIQDSRTNVIRLQNLTVAMQARDAQNAFAAAAAVSAVQAIAAVAAPSVVDQANAIPPVQTHLPYNPEGI